jgi:raffinose/stachyose/melibiose transport system permease protein
VWLARYTWRTFARELLLLAGAVFICVPLYLAITLSLKSPLDIVTKPLAFPPGFHTENYATAWSGSFGRTLGDAMLNTAIITGGSVSLLVGLGTLCAYTIARRPSRLSTGLYAFFLLGIIIPYQIAVVPVYVAMRHLGLVGNQIGMILLYTGLEMPLSVFLFTGFVRALPRDYEEAAQVDGASFGRTFRKIVLPLLRPIIATVALLTGLIVWNDFFLQLIFVGGTAAQTLPVTLYGLVDANLSIWNVIFAGVVIAIAPLLVFYLIAQKRLVRGFSGGIRG